MNTVYALDFLGKCSWIPCSRTKSAPRNDHIPVFFRILLARIAGSRIVSGVVAFALFMDYLIYGLLVPLPPYSPAHATSEEQFGLLYGAYAVGQMAANGFAAAAPSLSFLQVLLCVSGGLIVFIPFLLLRPRDAPQPSAKT
jgi:hypothetical protein